MLSVLLMYYFYVFLDKAGVCFAKNCTSCKSAQQYAELRSGPELQVNERYANVQMIVFVSMTYGVSMPVLFPLCFIFLLVNYIMERLMVIYFYRKPPMLDDELNNRALQMMKWAALLFALNGYWVFSNRQIFSNDITPKTRASAIEITNHTVFKLHDDNSQLLLWASIAMALIFVLVEVVNAL